MSKITKALEKAARQRLERQQERPTVAAQPLSIPLDVPGIGDVTCAGEVRIDPHIVSATDPSSPIAEQYRMLRTNLQSLGVRAGTSRTVVITSAVNGEGKSVTAVNLALTLALQEELRVVLVDADLRKGSVHQWLGLPETRHGTSTVLANNGYLNGSLVRLLSPKLTVLPAGPLPERPAELLQSLAMRRLVATLKRQFDVIVIDTPPVLPVADPGIIACQADGAILVVRAGKTQRRTVQRAQQALAQMKVNVFGCVVTHLETYLPGYAKYYHYYRYGGREGDGKPQPQPTALGKARQAVDAGATQGTS